MAELARGDSAMSKAFSQNWKWSHLIASACTEDQKERFLKPFLADHRYVMGRGITEPNAGSDNRMPPEDDPKAGYRLRAERDGDEWILNGEKCFIANGSVGSLFFVDARTNPDVNIKQGGTLFMVPKTHARLPHRQGVQQARLALLPERRADLRERARAARQRRGRRGHRLGQGGQGRHHRRRHLRRPRARGERARRVRRRRARWRWASRRRTSAPAST